MIEPLLAKQQELMDRVPHTLRPDTFVKMAVGIKVINDLMNYLNSCGHKPWRPEPLDPAIQEDRLAALIDTVDSLRAVHGAKEAPADFMPESEFFGRQMISALGIIEESVEYVNSVVKVDPLEERLEELVDGLFFWLEQSLMSGFTEEQIIDAYYRKWDKNIARYEALEKGDTSWDRRKDGKL